MRSLAALVGVLVMSTLTTACGNVSFVPRVGHNSHAMNEPRSVGFQTTPAHAQTQAQR